MNNFFKYLSIYCLVSNILAPIFLIFCLLSGAKFCYGIFEIVPIILNIGMFIFPFLFVFQWIKRSKKTDFKISKISFDMNSDKDEALVGEIHSVGKTFESNPKAIRVHADIENRKKDLIPGIFIKGKIHIDTEKTLALPESAIVKEGDKAYVFTAEKEGEEWSFIPVEVILGEKDDDWIAVRFMQEISENTKFAYNNAYYLIAEMKKGETAHEH